ncbi:MAG: hypothetical protein ACM3SP_09160 [Chloroflexota bacterium]
MKNFSLTARIAVLAAALSFWLSPAALHAQAVTSSLQLPLVGDVSVPLSDGSFDGVSLSGFAHVFSYVRTSGPFQPSDPYRIQINLDQVSGVGDVTGFRYQGTGAFRINLPMAPVDPINVSFDLRVAGVPPNPTLPTDLYMPLDISFVFNFDPFGDTLTNVSIQSISVPVP